MTLKRITWSLKITFGSIQSRFVSKLSVKCKGNVEDKMQAWQIHSYGGIDELKLSNVRIPMIAKPTDVLVKVEASSVNGMDVFMTRGYGATFLNFLRRTKNLTSGQFDSLELPLILGRDFTGTIVSRGHSVSDKYKLGEKVWGVVPVDQPGCHADYVLVDTSSVDLHPKNLSYIEAASILYAGLTAWSALWLTGGLWYKTSVPSRSDSKLLLLGGSGGVGTLAIQLAKIWNMHVVTTCNADAIDLVQELGADIALDYTHSDTTSTIVTQGPYNIIFDCANEGLHTIRSKGYRYNTYITLNSPVLRNTDEFGLIVGNVKNIKEIIKCNAPFIGNKGSVKWGFFVPCKTGIKTLRKYIESGKMVPVVREIYPFQELPAAYKRMDQGHMRGKIVVDMKYELPI